VVPTLVAGILLDFYGTVVEEDDELIAAAAQEIAAASPRDATAADVSGVWGAHFASGCGRAHGPNFLSQREIERAALRATVEGFGAAGMDVDAIADRLFRHWRAPSLFPDAARFLDAIDVPVVVVSNIDRPDLDAAIAHCGLDDRFHGIVASSDVRAYKPRPEPFAAGIGMFRALDVEGGAMPDRLLHIGDSRTGDLVGADRFGLPVAYVDRFGRPSPDGITLAATVANLDELLPLPG
jgi:2-haloacid dehalogenase/putative hydrolase of the HAD superfamily